jgi:uncharacterized protein
MAPQALSDRHVAVIRAVYAAFNHGDVAGVLTHFHPAIEWHAAENSPAGPGSPYLGVQAVVTQVFQQIGADFSGMQIEMQDLFASGERVVALGHYVGVRHSTGRHFRAQVAHIWTLSEGKAIRFQQYTDTYQFALAGPHPVAA